MAALSPHYRTAGVFLLLTALATAISVPARLAAGADDTPFTDSLAQRVSLDAAVIAELELSEKLSAIGAARGAYGTGGVARLAGGLTLLAAAFFLCRALCEFHPPAMRTAAAVLAASGIASAASGACAIGLAILAPEPQSTAALLPVGDLVGGTEETLATIRWAAGALGFTLAGLALVALAPVQWRMGRALRYSAAIGGVLGVAMLFIWVDAATAVHRVTGIAFLVWLIAAGVWLIVPRLRTTAGASTTRR